ncbi:MAG: aminotransferase class V-fold PLP-dependent enzyme [Minisyncoccia bacterium]
MKKPIFISLSPNTQKDDIILALKLIFRPWLWKKNENTKRKLEEKLKTYFNVKYVIFFNAGRSALMAILNCLNFKKNSEIIVPSFTCNALLNPIIWQNLNPVFVDCEKETLNYKIEEIEKNITKKTRAIVVQHTFGLPENIDEISKICKKYNLVLIEDCAHALGANFNKKKIGTIGDISFFSFGRDKIISSVFGGAVITNNDLLGKKLIDYEKKLDFPSYFWIFQQLLHPILINYLIIPLYNFFEIGRYLLIFLQKINILSKSVYKKEKEGEKVKYFPKKFPNALLLLLENQFNKLEKYNLHRQKIADFYYDNLKDLDILLPKNQEGRIYLKFPLLFNKETKEILKLARKEKIFLDDGWRDSPIVPPDVNLQSVNYIKGKCKNAEEISKKILNLPTHINIKIEDAKIITDFLKKICSLK